MPTEYRSGIEDAVNGASSALKDPCGANVKCVIDGLVDTVSDAQALLYDTYRIEREEEARIPQKCGLFCLSVFVIAHPKGWWVV
jgi:hypothetical protein